MFGPVDLNNVQSFSPPATEETHHKLETIKQLAEDSMLTSEQREKLFELEAEVLRQEQQPENNIKFSSKQFVQIKDEVPQQEQLPKTSPVPSLEENQMDSSTNQIDEDDLFSQDTDDIYDARNKTKSEVTQEKTASILIPLQSKNLGNAKALAIQRSKTGPYY